MSPAKRILGGGQGGQAATECVIIAAFVLVPLFLLVPLLGKYIDIKQASVQQARYEVWEYTVWFDRGESPMTGIANSQRAGQRRFAETRARGNRLFFGDVTARNYGDLTAAVALNPLWVDQHGDELLVRSGLDQGDGQLQERNTPDPTSGLLDGGLINGLLHAVDTIAGLFGRLLHALGVDGWFDALNTAGYFTSRFAVDARSMAEVVPDLSTENPFVEPLTFRARAAVLARGWNAGSTGNAASEARGLVPTALLAPVSTTFNGIVNPVNGLFEDAHRVLHGFHAKLPLAPQFGYVDDDLVPYEHLEGDARTVKEYEGLSYYGE